MHENSSGMLLLRVRALTVTCAPHMAWPPPPCSLFRAQAGLPAEIARVYAEHANSGRVYY